MASEKGAPLLDLSTFTERYVVRIDGKNYDLANPGEFTVRQNHELSEQAAAVQALVAGATTDEDVERLETTLRKLCRTILRVPDELYDKLNDSQRLQVVHVFTKLWLEVTPRVGAVDAAERSTGENSSPGSPGSMAGRRWSGLRKLLWPWSSRP